MRRHRTVMTDRTETMTQEGAAPARKTRSELTSFLHIEKQGYSISLLLLQMFNMD